jgi:CRP-like cAMP-binding protein
MNQTEFRDGEIVLTEGAPSDFVYRILIGEVEIFSEKHGEIIVLGIAKAGEFLGEMGIIERRPRSASARARGDVLIEKLERWEFIQMISDSPISANRLIERLSERLRHVNQMFTNMAAGAAPQDAPDDASSARVKLFAATERLAASIPDGGINITEFPFTIGREPHGDEPLSETAVDLQIRDTIPFRLSSAHFSLECTDDGFAVRDLGGARGTSVNGVFIGDHFERDICDLNTGENTIIAGGINSVFGFKIFVTE